MPDKFVNEIKNNLLPGKALLVNGPYGNAKFERVTLAIKAAGLKQYTCHLSIWHELLGYSLSKWAKEMPGNGVMVFDYLTNPPPDKVEFILTQMKNPDRIIVLTGKSCPFVIASRCAKIITISTEDHLKAFFNVKE
jgi:hypothetical protein